VNLGKDEIGGLAHWAIGQPASLRRSQFALSAGRVPSGRRLRGQKLAIEQAAPLARICKQKPVASAVSAKPPVRSRQNVLPD
jgi:hypothetical protein